jgi:cyclic beta-1,2-glucan synthetase
VRGGQVSAESSSGKKVVLAFFAGGQGAAKQAVAALQSTRAEVRYSGAGRKVGEPFNSLRLADEELVVVRAEPLLVPAVLSALRACCEPAVFVTASVARTESDKKGRQVEAKFGWRRAFDCLREMESSFSTVRAELIEASRVGHSVTESGRWILDNSYLVESSVSEISRSLPRWFRRSLTRRMRSDGALPVHELARNTVNESNRAIDEPALIEAVSRYQTETPLSISELWAFPVMLRFALVETLAGLARGVGEQQRCREDAFLWANRLATAARVGEPAQARILELMRGQAFASDPCFATCLAEQLQEEEAALIPVQRWIESEHGAPLPELVRREHNREAAESLAVANAFNGLRALSRIDFSEFFEKLNVVHLALRCDPAGTYARSDFRTRDRCRRAVEILARRSGQAEWDIARKAIEAASSAQLPERREVCWHLLSAGLFDLEKALGARLPVRVRFIRLLRAHATGSWLFAIAAVTLGFLAVAVGLAMQTGMRQPVVLGLLAVLSLFPLSELAIQIVNALVIASFEPEVLPRLDFDSGIPADHATLVVVPMMLTGKEVIARELEKLEVRYLANRDANLSFGLLSDYVDAPSADMPEDGALLEEARSGIAGLCTRYPGSRFLLFHRDRVWSESEQQWIGRERKRGKIEELNKLLRGKHTGNIVRAGDLPSGIRYVIALDADTQLPPGAARQLAATIAHPLNRPVLDPDTRVRRSGFSVIQPRVSVGLPGATASRFTRIFADTSGTDPYCQAVSDASQDFFGEAIFHGKAIYDVEAFDESTGDRFPAETLLSHDLIEGSYAGVALASDIELFENIPIDYAGFSQRAQRWIRGDWQIAAWAFRTVPDRNGVKSPNPLSAISRWRILDNLRRSLVPIASLLLLALGWVISGAPGVWSLVVGLAVAIPALAPVLERLARRVQGTVQGWRGVHDELLRAIVSVAFLPYQAWISADAISRALYRRLVSKRSLLEWHTAERVHAQAHLHMSSTMRRMSMVGAASVFVILIAALEKRFAPVSVFVLLWSLSPALLFWLNRPLSETSRRAVRPHGRMLRGCARQTWRFFDDLVGDSTNWLPPDNYQTALRIEVANRTSPTNISLWLCSALAARDFGYLTPDELSRRCSKTMDTLNRMERYEGHLLNWYATDTCEPLSPRYVSTVDSGNLVAGLWVLAQGIEDVLHAPILSQRTMLGLRDTLALLENIRSGDPSLAVPIVSLRKLFHGKGDCHELLGRIRMASAPAHLLADINLHATARDDSAYWAAKVAAEVKEWNETSDRYLKWIETLTRMPDTLLRQSSRTISEIRNRLLRRTWSLAALASDGAGSMQALLAFRQTPYIDPRVAEWLNDLDNDYSEARRNAAHAQRELQSLARRAVEFADSMNMGFLFDGDRKLFGIGYLVGGPVEFTSHYDLLASECRIASLVAIAKGDVPVEHWFVLGRPRATSRTEGSSEQALLSWSGTMFEYLMPLLFTRTFENSLLDEACRNAVAEQMRWGREKKLPWGVSECAWSALDSSQIYQYHAFGIPALAMKPRADERNVVAPYATMLALPLVPESAVDNLERLRGLGLDGPMGFYEAIDFTRPGSSTGQRGVPIFTYMAHHQGMTLLALDNALHRGVMQRRFHADRRIRAIESVLFERIPNTPAPSEERAEPFDVPVPALGEEPADRIRKENSIVPRVHVYGNGRYSLMVTNAGSGYSRWNDFDVTRWRSDPTCDSWGSFVYVSDTAARAVWSTAWHPLGGGIGSASVRFMADHTEFHRRALDIETLQAVTVAAEDDAELRRITVTNWSPRPRELELTSYIELALAPHAADTAHPAFAKMFVETEALMDDGLLLAHRRPRSNDEAPVWAGHMIVAAAPAIDPSTLQFETDRASFLGRNNTPASPVGLRRDLNGAAGSVIDPAFALRCRLSLSPRDRVEVSFITFAAASREEALAIAAKYRGAGAVGRAFEMTWTRTQLQFRYLGIGKEHAQRFQELASYLLYPNPRLRPADRIARNTLAQSGLWASGISGDLPILAVTISGERGLDLIRELLQAHTYWRMRGLRADFAILNQESPSYDAPLRSRLQYLIGAHSAETGVDKPGGVFLRDWYSLPEDHRNLLLASAGVVLGGHRGSLQQQMAGISDPFLGGARIPVRAAAEDIAVSLPFLELAYFNGQGGFSGDQREYAIYLKAGDNTPAPWINVMANSQFGAIVSESGLGCCWHGNSQMNRLTPWSNDPVGDEPSEAIYLRDEESGQSWSPTPQPMRGSDAYRARHGQGYTVFEHSSYGIGQELLVFVPVDANGDGEPVRVCRLRLRNHSSRPRKLSATWFASLVLGGVRENMQTHVVTSRDEKSGALFARQYRNPGYAGQVAFGISSPEASSYSCDRAQFLGRNRSIANPAALERVNLDNRTGAALDPCMALRVPLNVPPGAQVEVTFLFGQADSAEESRRLMECCRTPEQVEALLASTCQWWDSVTGAIQVKTPLLSADLMLNRWLLYQSLGCRFEGRTAFYQSGGAFGFRDQLQDSLAFVYSVPHITRLHILRAAARQFLEGDVQHWWHAETGMGVRTRCSDDLLWLPYAVAHYVSSTGDSAILDEQVPFLEAPLLAADEHERLSIPSVSQETATLLEHCRRALDRASETGAHGLPLMGNGDWNDGMNLVGAGGRGESVWLAWFLAATLVAFAELAEATGRASLAAPWRERASNLAAAVERSAWDGDWYLRAFFDNGAPLGAHANSEARIDSLSQTWAVISGQGDPERRRRAMESAQALLVDSPNKLVRLFTPPFDKSEPHPGYIMGYPPGLRENGGQYTHGSLWMAMAWARLGRGDRAVELLSMMNPIELTRTPEDAARYCGEPYVVAADVSDAPGRVGRAGWTWYTGSAGWMYRIWIEEILGFRLHGSELTLSPVIPDEWPGFEISCRFGSAIYRIVVSRNVGPARLRRDGATVDGPTITLTDDGLPHRIELNLPLAGEGESEHAELALALNS